MQAIEYQRPKTKNQLLFEVELKWLAKILKFKIKSSPLAPRYDDKTTTKTRSQKSFELRGKDYSNQKREDFVDAEKPALRPSAEDEKFLRERTFEELKTLVKAIQIGATDPWQLTDLIFYARHPELKGTPLTDQNLLDEWNSISALLVHPTINEIKNLVGSEDLTRIADDKIDLEKAFAKASNVKINVGSLDSYTTRYDDVIANAVEWCPGLSAAVLKSLIAQESKFHPTVINQYGYAGIAQFGRPAAREVGLYVGVAGSASDERLDPSKAIPGAARLLNIKAQRLGRNRFFALRSAGRRGVLEIRDCRLQRRRRHGRAGDGTRLSQRFGAGACQQSGRNGCRQLCTALRIEMGKSESRRRKFPARSGGGAIFPEYRRAKICRDRKLPDTNNGACCRNF